jgi:DNA polymerase I
MASKQQELFSTEVTPHVEHVAVPVAAALATMVKRVTLIDASGFIFRAYHALPPMTTSKGVPTHAVLGFTRMLLKLLRERQPPYVALCFDKDSRKGRLAIDPQYKANREAPPSDLVTQFKLIEQVADALNLPRIECVGWEADDVIATLTKQALREGYEVEIVTSDKDFLQLLAPGVTIFDAMKDKPIGEAEALEKFGVKPPQMRDYQALVGDAIDNIPKVPGIGPKTAVELLEQFGTVDALLLRISEVKKPKIRAALEENIETLKRALNLVTFRSDLALNVTLGDLKRGELHDLEARTLFTELEFFRLMQEMPSAKPTQLNSNAQILDTEDAVRAFLSNAGNEISIFPLFESEEQNAPLLGVAFATADHVAYTNVFTDLAPQLGRFKIMTHDGKLLLHAFNTLGIKGLVLHSDVQLLSYLLNPSRKEHSLNDLARERLATELPSWPQNQNGKGKMPVELIERSHLASLAGAQADAILKMSAQLWHEISLSGLSDLATNLEMPLMHVLANMEQRGIALDLNQLAQTASVVDAACETLLVDVYKAAGHEFNVGSPAQLAHVLFEELKLPVIKKNKSGPSTDHEVLEKLGEEHPLPRAIIEYRNVAKLKSTYLDTLPTMLGTDSRIHTTFHQALAATGRLSSVNPNLQNIPIRTNLGREIRKAFVAKENWELVSADYSQIELRILAHISNDAALVEAFQSDSDVHARTAAEVFEVKESEVTDLQRRAAKMVNYGIAYGLSPHGLAIRLNISREEAKSIIDRYFARFTGISQYIESTLERARKVGYVETLFGRRRSVPDIVSRNRQVAMGAERAAINMPIQGTAADLIKRAMLKIETSLSAGFEAKMLLQVHDELLFESPTSEIEKLTAMAKMVMTSDVQWRVPLKIDVGHSRSWGGAH